MVVEILKNSGYCYGVKNAIKIAFKLRKENPNQKIYVLGMLVHNEEIIKKLELENIITINVPYNEYEKEIQKINQNDILIFPAHGHDIKLEKITKVRQIKVVDAICPMVKRCQDLIIEALNKKKKVIYIGIKNHAETLSALSLSKDIIFVDYNQPINYYFNTKYDYYCINQTTLSYIQLDSLHNQLKKLIPHLEIANEICNFTKIRQKSLLNLPDDVDGIIVCGSLKSSNTTRLFELAKKRYPNCYVSFVSNTDEIDLLKIKSLQHIIILGGTSTSMEQLEELKEYLLKLNN